MTYMLAMHHGDMTTDTAADRALVRRALNVIHLDLRVLSDLPAAVRIILAGGVAAVGSLIADVILVALGKAAFNPISFGPFHASAWVPLTILGVAGATVGWGILVHLTSEPRWVVFRAAVLVTLVLLLPDVGLLPSNPTGPVLTLMAMHIAIAVITTVALLRISPATGAAVSRSSRPPR
jgi:hypothetical protein